MSTLDTSDGKTSTADIALIQPELITNSGVYRELIIGKVSQRQSFSVEAVYVHHKVLNCSHRHSAFTECESPVSLEPRS